MRGDAEFIQYVLTAIAQRERRAVLDRLYVVYLKEPADSKLREGLQQAIAEVTSMLK